MGAIEYGLCHCGCGQKTKLAEKTERRKRWVKGEPKNYIANHFHKGSRSIEVRWIIDPTTGCWNWALAISDTGYGVSWNGEKLEPAHRLVIQTIQRRYTCWLRLRPSLP